MSYAQSIRERRSASVTGIVTGQAFWKVIVEYLALYYGV
jgi:hypothetical protein